MLPHEKVSSPTQLQSNSFIHHYESFLFYIFLWISLLLGFYTGCSNTSPSEKESLPSAVVAPQYGGVYRKPLEHEPPLLDPAFATDIYATSVVQQLFDGLVQFDGDLNVIPSIARSWQASYDGLVWTFLLRPGVRFHHGREVVADDFVYTFTRLLAPQTQSPHASLLQHIEGAADFRAGKSDHVSGLQALDPMTLQITLDQPYAPFMTILGMVQTRVVPREEVEKPGFSFGRQPVGSGPFRFVAWEAGKQITLQANHDYFEGRPFLNFLHFVIFRGQGLQGILEAFEKGLLEEAGLPAQERQRLTNTSSYRFVRKPVLATLLLWINTSAGPLSQTKVRQAINYAINRQTINQVIRQNRFELARGILPPGMPGYDPHLVGYPYNPERARQLLAEAGYPEGQGLPPVELWSSVVSAEAQAEHQAIQHDLAAIGITASLHTEGQWQRFSTQILGQRPEALYRYAWYADFPDPDNFLFALFHSQSPNNFAHYRNPQVDHLLEKAQQENDYLKRIALYRQAEAIIMEDAPTVNLVYYTFERVFHVYVKGIELNALGERHIPFKKVWLDRSTHGSSTTISPR